ncbi:MAG: DUF4157 domain-containing protein [Rhodospirillales bacterium]
MFKPIALLLFILGIGALIAAAQPGEERGDPAKAISADGGTSSAAGGLIAGLEAGGTALATAADAVAGQVEAEAMNLVLAQGAPYLGTWIRRTRDDALARGTQPIPADIRRQLRKYYPEALLKPVRWRVGLSADGSLPARLFQAYGRALTLDDVIIFRDDATARDPVIWAHEVAHIQQYQRWGIEGFARRYVENFRAVEREAWDVTGDWAARQGDPSPP